jgi:thiamine-phosphate pyrophosphorylase
MDVRLIGILDAGRIPPDDLAAWLRAARDGGLTGVQLRDKVRAARDVYAYGQRLKAAAHALGLWLAVDDRLDLALALGADAVHLGTTDLPPAAARRVAPRLAIGLSAANLGELAAAVAHRVAYVGFGPVFATASKPDGAPPTGLAALGEAVRASPVPVVAIGGITPEAADGVWAQGVAGIAVISALADADDLADLTRRARALTRGAPSPRAGGGR